MVGRRDECKRLIQAVDSAPQLVVVRGRRRVGKSFLLDRALSGHRTIYFQADEGATRSHLDFLAVEIGRLTGAPLAFADWNEALEYLGALASSEQLVVVLDEFQWLLRAQPQLDSIVMRHFDRWERSQTPITLVLSGSALTLMEDLLEGNRPMFGRAAYRPLLQPFDYRDAALFGPHNATAEKKLLRYGILGGTAQYQVWAGQTTVGRLLAQRVLARGESLFDEPLQLIRGEDEIREPGNYYEILRAIAGGATQFSEIVNRSKVSSGQVLTKRLRSLERLRYLDERKPVAGNGRTAWTVSDPYFRFWFRYVYPNRSRLQRGRVDDVREAILADVDNHMGPIFEQVCRDWASTYASNGRFPAAEEVGAYWTRTHDVEIDVVARTRSRLHALGSCKWGTADTHDLDRLKDRRSKIAGAGRADLYVFARAFHPALVRRAGDEGVRLISADELYD